MDWSKRNLLFNLSFMKKFYLLKPSWQHLLFLILGLSIGINTSAQDCMSMYNLVVWEKGETEPLNEFKLEYGATVTFNEGQIIITNDVADIILDNNLDEIWKLTYKRQDDTGIQNIFDNSDSMKFNGSAIIFPSLKAGSNVSVFAANGILLMSKTIATTGEYAFPLSNLNQGIYIVNVNGKTYKISKK